MDIVQMSVQAGVLIAAIVLVRAITLYRLPKASFLALWGIVIARLLIPFSLTSRWSVYNLFAGLWGHEDTTVPTGSYVTVWGDQAQVPASPEAALSIPPLTALWMVGAVVLVVVFAVLLAKNYRALRAAVPVEDRAVITKWREEYRLLRPLAIVRSDKVDSPASIGILRPRIIFPQGMDLDNEQLVRYILVHEYVHIRRFDTLWKLLALCAVCVHWFNPLVWVMLVLLNRDLELSCDEMVLRHFGGTERASYAHSLIDMAERGRPFSFMHSYFSKNAAEERIIAIMKYKKTSLLAVVLALVLTLGMATGFTTGAVAKDNNSSLPNDQTPTSERNNKEAGLQDTDSALGGLASVNRGDEGKFTPEEWAEILKKVEAGEILLFETAEEERAFWEDEDNAALKESLILKGSISMRWEDFPAGLKLTGTLDGTENMDVMLVPNTLEKADLLLGDNAKVYFVSKDDSPFGLLVNEIKCTDESGDGPYYIADEASVKAIEAGFGSTYKWLSSEGDAYTDIAPGAEMPIGIVTLGKDQSIVVSLSYEDPSDCSVIEVGLKKENSSEKLVIKEAGGDFDGLTAECSVEESGEYVLYVRNTGKTSAGFSISYLIR